MVALLENVVSHTINVFTWGSNIEGQCGQNKEQNIIYLPTLVKELTKFKIEQIRAGQNFTVVFTSCN